MIALVARSFIVPARARITSLPPMIWVINQQARHWWGWVVSHQCNRSQAGKPWERRLLLRRTTAAERRLVISRKSGAESELVRAYTCVVELDVFNALSPPVRQPRRWFRLAPRTSLGEEARPPTATETCRRLCCAALQRFLSATPTAATLAAWRYSLQSAAPHRASAAWPLSATNR